MLRPSGRLKLAYEVPGLPFAVSPAAGGPVRLVADQRRADAVGDLPTEQQHPGQAVLEAEHRMVIDQQVGEPHGGAQVVEKVAHCVAQAPEGG